MSWLAVDFQLVRYSPVEGTHWFYDPAYPAAVQFLLEGRWQPWDVGWVKQRAQDPEIRRVAEDAESRLVHDLNSGYRSWPTQPPTPTRPDPPINGHVPPVSRTLPPSLSNGEPFISSVSSHQPDHPNALTSPTSPLFHQNVAPLQSPSYTSPYSSQIHSSAAPAAPSTVALTQDSTQTQPYHAQEQVSSQQHASSQVNSSAHRRLSSYSFLSPIEDSPPLSASGPSQPPPPVLDHHLVSHPHAANGHLPSAHVPIDPALRDTPPPVLPVTTNRETKILLSLDGDGVRGLTSVLLVESLVNAVCSRIDRRVDPHQIFDLIGGVSTGGLLAIMIGRLRMRVHRAREAYVNVAHHVYRDKLRFFQSLDPHKPRQEQEEQALEKSIKDLLAREDGDPDERFFDERPGATNVFAISTKVEIGVNQAAIIRSYPTRRMAGPEVDGDLSIWQAIQCTLAAPRYIDPHGGHDRRAVIAPGLFDYGTAKNNPVRDLFYECRKLYSYANDTMVIVSIGTGTGCDRSTETLEMANSIQDRKADAMNNSDKFETDMRDLRERGWMKYFRFNVPDLHDVPLDESAHLDRLMAKTHAYLAEPEVSQQFYGCVDAIAAILMSDLGACSRYPY